MGAVSELPKLVTEAEAYEVYGAVLQDKELRRARQARVIGYYKRRGKVLYREDELAAYVEAAIERSYVAPCGSQSGNTGSTPFQDQPTSIGSGMSPELERAGASRLRQQTSRKPKSGSQGSSSGKGKLRLVSQET